MPVGLSKHLQGSVGKGVIQVAPPSQYRHSFFQTLGVLAGSRQRENQISRTFKACFDASPAFRSRVLELLGRTCAVPVKVGEQWECLAEIGHDAGGRLDIVLGHLRSRHSGWRARSNQFSICPS
jgi:hypothetical protein